MSVFKRAAFVLLGVAAAAAISLPVNEKSISAAQLLGRYKAAAVFLDGSLSQLQVTLLAPQAAVVVLAGDSRPTRRAEDDPLISFAPAVAAVLPQATQAALVAGMKQVELLRGARLFPVRLDVMHQQQLQGAAQLWPWAVFEVSSGTVLVRPELLGLLQSGPVEGAAVLVNAGAASLEQLVKLMQQGLPAASMQQLTSLLSKATAAGVALAFAAAVPKWFCFVCPILLGLLAPLVINAGVGEAANMACKAWQLPDDECVDLWFSALAEGMVLSLLSAIPIFKVCRMYECAHSNATTAAAAA